MHHGVDHRIAKYDLRIVVGGRVIVIHCLHIREKEPLDLRKPHL